MKPHIKQKKKRETHSDHNLYRHLVLHSHVTHLRQLSTSPASVGYVFNKLLLVPRSATGYRGSSHWNKSTTHITLADATSSTASFRTAIGITAAHFPWDRPQILHFWSSNYTLCWVWPMVLHCTLYTVYFHEEVSSFFPTLSPYTLPMETVWNSFVTTVKLHTVVCTGWN